MSAHTPGPWRAEAQPYDSSSFYIRGSDKNGNELTWGKGAVAHIPRSTVMPMEANARLIAAAPKLLHAAERAEAFIAGFDDDNKADDIAGMLRDLRAAIANATGSAS